MPEAKTVAVAEPPKTAVISADDLALMKQHQHKSDFKKEDLATPWLIVVQSGSPYVKRNEPQFIENAREGDILDTLTLRPVQRVGFIPCKYESHITEWKPNRGGLVKQWMTDRSAYDAAGKDFGTRKNAEGNDLVPTAVFYGLTLYEDGMLVPTILSMGSTAMKTARRFSTLIDALEVKDADGNSFTPPMYSRIYELTTVGESNDQGSWATWKIEPGVMVLSVPGGKGVFEKAAAFRKQIDEGTVVVAQPVAAQAAAAEEGRRETGDDPVPF